MATLKMFTEEIEAGLKEEFSTENYRSLFYETYKNYDVSILKTEIKNNLDEMSDILSKFSSGEYKYKKGFYPESKAFHIVNEPVFNYLKSYAIVKAGHELLSEMTQVYLRKFKELRETGIPVDQINIKPIKPNWDEQYLDDEQLLEYMEYESRNTLFSELDNSYIQKIRIDGLDDMVSYMDNIKSEMEESNKKLATLIPVIASKLTIYIDENLYYFLRLGHKIINTENSVD